MTECRFYPVCNRLSDVGDAWIPCDGTDEGTTCGNFEPMPDVDALLELADKLRKESWKLQVEYMNTGIEPHGYELAIAQQNDWMADCILEACGEGTSDGNHLWDM